jgi:hypothetical protein
MGSIPDRFVRNNNLAPVLDLVRNSLELASHNLNRLTRLTLLEALAAAQNHADATVKRSLGLGRNKFVVFLQDDTALRVADERPCDAAVLELFGRDLACKGTAGLVEDVLCGNFDTFAEVLAGEEEVEGGRSNNDLWRWC